MGLTEAAGAGPIAVDTALFIYLIEEHPHFLAPVRALFARADAGELEMVTSALTLLEVLEVPYRAGDRALAARYEALLTRSRGVKVVDLSRDQLRTAARLRAQHPTLRTPDAIQLAAAIGAGCTAFVTNDRRLPSPDGLRVLQLSECA
ncbi:MAG: type II toxin-antitoxin system VapC family toxin [Gemmatimonas sp.]|uniref:type II toxin-antitoxin system VapC family toxin n=1 Tax=Gemmatimonas sp. TaxID=1962908 RepID=UPI00391D0D1F|nr:PIN domain-containing protein [Gemmatimonadota bacterium]